MEQLPSIPAKVVEYERFVNETLRSDLARVEDRAARICDELSSYLQIGSLIKQIKSKDFGDGPLKIQSDIGSNFYAQCVVPETDRMFIYLGLGFYVEFTLDEAETFIGKKEAMLRDSLKQCADQENRIKAYIKYVLEGLRELQNIE